MSVEEILGLIAAMTPADRSDTRIFLAESAEADAEACDREIEADALSGKLDKLAAEALEDYRAGRVRKL